MIWRFRHYLKEYPDALPKFLKSVYWMNNESQREAFNLLNSWSKLKYDDALFLLSRDFASNTIYSSLKSADYFKMEINLIIREFAISVLRNDKKLKTSFILLQLVSALRYEVLNKERSPLLAFLIEIASTSEKLACSFFWQIQVESESKIEEIKNWYLSCLDTFMNSLHINKPEFHNSIQKQKKFRAKIGELAGQALHPHGKPVKAIKESFIKNSSKKENLQEIEADDNTKGFFLLNEGIHLTNLNVQQTKVFGSATKPILLNFGTTEKDKNYKFLYKKGDDLRTDQLIIQMISLMDYLMKELNLDLRLTVYNVLSFSSDDGIVEFVENSVTMQHAIRYPGKLEGYFQHLTQEKNDKKNGPKIEKDSKTKNPPKEIDPEILDNYVESLAGYCAITFLLGIGDRHLENLMLDQNGKIFHIDFGFSLGEDPKFYLPIKLTSGMIKSKSI